VKKEKNGLMGMPIGGWVKKNPTNKKKQKAHEVRKEERKGHNFNKKAEKKRKDFWLVAKGREYEREKRK